MTDFSRWCSFYERYFLEGQRHDGSGERMSLVLEGEPVVLIVVRDVGFVVHDQKFPEGHVFHVLLVFGVMLQ